MRIRRRQAQFLPPAPPSDLPPNPSPPVQHLVPHPHENPPAPLQPLALLFPSPPPDQANQRLPSTASGPDGWDWPGMKKKQRLKVGRCEDERLRDGEKSNDTRKGISRSGAETGHGVLPFSSSSGREVVSWGEGEKAFPLKKRRGSFERGVLLLPPMVNQETIMEKEKKMKAKIMKTKMNMKCVVERDHEEEEEHGSEERETKQEFYSSSAASPAAPAAAVGAKKRSRGGALMEGSRCSRVNGRGWRCCQQTLVGYSLCEHHLGKGRLRSMSSVRSPAASTTKNQTQESFNPLSSQSLRKNQNQAQEEDQKREKANPVRQSKGGAAADIADDDYDDYYDEKPAPVTGGGCAKKRVKIGMVKARSLSSLLGLAVVAAADHNK